ncbi:MAG: TetR/AcrR family transcriptional regulator C-terminal domain-containing protein [Micropruina sp.]|uniref:TetR/AcrR family transcriptional regulator C-terminal domain-containing protein n=1 Tax=Micropruina sp. TaxID=2737536 RepID=UPI0039E6C4F1
MIKPGGVGRGLTRDQIVAAAFEVLDEHGLDGLTMRKVAARLGVQAAALYWHISDKADLLDEMGTSMWRTATVALFDEPDDDLARGLTEAARRMRAAMLAHRDGATVFAGRRLTDVGLIQVQERPLAVLVAAGRSLEDILDTWQIVMHFTIGWTAEEQGVSQAREADPSSYDLAERDARLGADTHPLMAHAGHLMFADPQARFERVIARLVTALTASAP